MNIYKLFFAIAFLVIVLCLPSCSQNEIMFSRSYFTNDTTVSTDSSKGYIVKYSNYKIGIDSSDWLLYRIENDTFYYFKIVGFGTENYTEYPPDSLKKWTEECLQRNKIDTKYFCMVGGTYSNLVAYYNKLYMKANYLLSSSKVKDTIPETINFYSEAINADNPNAAYGHTIVKYYVGGFLGEFVREKHLNDAKKR